MISFRKNLLVFAMGAAFSAVSAHAEEATSVTQALTDGDVKLSFRLRFEDVDVDTAAGVSASTDLLSLKTRLTFTSMDYKGLGLGLEMDDVTHVTEYEPEASAGIGDPEGTEVNQYYLTYKFGKSVAKYGRQRILLDNQRFVGGVGFRQNEQTYDAFSITSNDIENLSLFAAYITNVNRIFGEANPAGDHSNETILFNSKYTISPAIALSGYYYGIDNLTAPGFSTDTIGLRAAGSIQSFTYAAEYANQTEAGDNPAQYSASYIGLEGSYAFKPVKVTLGYEVLGADGSDGQFITPLATLHKFQGWTDQFLGGGSGNRRGGIVDGYLNVAAQIGPIKLVGSYHMLSADDADVTVADDPDITGFDDYGSEVGFVVAGKLKGVGLSLKYADFSADSDSGLNDVSKLWLMAESTF